MITFTASSLTVLVHVLDLFHPLRRHAVPWRLPCHPSANQHQKQAPLADLRLLRAPWPGELLSAETAGG
jgi:hypothetical protein